MRLISSTIEIEPLLNFDIIAKCIYSLFYIIKSFITLIMKQINASILSSEVVSPVLKAMKLFKREGKRKCFLER